MIQKLKRKLLIFSSLFIFSPLLLTASVSAADTVDIRNSTCAGSGITITSDPSANACENIDKNGAKDANKLIETVINILSAIIGILAVIMIIFAGFRYVTSGGSDDAVKGAKRTILYAIIGLVIVALAQIIVHFVLAKTSQATTPNCVASGSTHKWDSGPDAGKACSP